MQGTATVRSTENRRTGRITAPIFLACLSVSLSGCKTLGPISIPADRFNYNLASAQSANEQMLLNILRLRYGEPIHFLEIGSMLSQYQFNLSGQVSGWENDLNVWRNPALRAIYNIDGDPGAQDAWQANITYSDSPTITYAPLQGEAFANRVMSPIPPATVFYLSQSGWSIDRLLECCVQQIGKVRNAPIHDIQGADFWSTVKFRTVADLLKKIQDAGRLQFAVEVDAKTKAAYLFPPQDMTGFEEEVKELNDLMGMAPGLQRIKIVQGGHEIEKGTLLMKTRSLLGMMNALAQAITPPKKHIEGGYVQKVDAEQVAVVTQPWLTVEFSTTPNLDPFVQVRYNGYWWYIKKSDWQSKRTFALLTYLFSLQATETAASLPLVTVQAGGR